MPPTLNQQIQAKCDRLAELEVQMKGIAEAAADRLMTADEAAAFDAAETEAKTLTAEIGQFKADQQRRARLTHLAGVLDEARPLPCRLESPDTQTALREVRNGTYRLRHFRGENAHLRAYHAGLATLYFLTGGTNRSLIRQRAADAGLNVESLAMGEGSNVQGGFLVHPEFEAVLINLKEQYGVLQQEAYRIPMASETKSIPRRAGGLTVYYPDEHGEITASEMKFDLVQLVAKKYAALTRYSVELNEDSIIAMTDILAGEFAYAFAKAEDRNGFIGDGTSSYAGVAGILHKMQYGTNGVVPSASVSTATGHTSVGALTLGDFEAMVGMLPVYAEGRAKWYMHKTVFWAGPARLIDAAGGNIAIYLSTGTPLMFLGYEVVPVQAMPTNASLTTAEYALLLGDMQSTCHMGLRRGVGIASSEDRYFELDQLALKATQRVAINNVVGDAEAPTSNAGPMVCLKLG